MKVDLFEITDLAFTPASPGKGDPFTVRGKVDLFDRAFVLPVWVIMTVEYPEQWWEELLPIIGAPQVREGGVVVGGEFEVTFKEGFRREGQYKLNTSLYVGPTMAVDSLTLPPFPPVVSKDTTFSVSGEGDQPPKPPSGGDIADFNVQVQGGTYSPGDDVPLTAVYKYKGPAQGGKLTIALGKGIYPSFSLIYSYTPLTIFFESSASWKEYSTVENIPLPVSGLERGQTYSVRSRLETADGAQETDTDWSVLTIKGEGAPPAPPPPPSKGDIYLPSPGFEMDKGEYPLGTRVFWSLRYGYKGPSQGGWLTISMGSGTSPSFFTKHTFTRTPVRFNESAGFTEGYFSGSIVLPDSLQTGQTYSVRAKLEAADGAQETDTDWSVLTIKGEGAPPPPPTEPGFRNFRIYKYTAKPWGGSICYVHVMFDYQGPAASRLLYAALGKQWPGFLDEYCVGSTTIQIAEAASWQTRLGRVDIEIPYGASLGTYTVMAKIDSGTPEVETRIKDAVEIIP